MYTVLEQYDAIDPMTRQSCTIQRVQVPGEISSYVINITLGTVIQRKTRYGRYVHQDITRTAKGKKLLAKARS